MYIYVYIYVCMYCIETGYVVSLRNTAQTENRTVNNVHTK